MADLTPEALAPLLYAAAIRAKDGVAAPPDEMIRAVWDALTPGYTTGWLAAAHVAVDQLAPAHAALTGQLARVLDFNDRLEAENTTIADERNDLLNENAQMQDVIAVTERERDAARAERDRYRAALEAIAECRAGMPYPVLAREALEGGHG